MFEGLSWTLPFSGAPSEEETQGPGSVPGIPGCRARGRVPSPSDNDTQIAKLASTLLFRDRAGEDGLGTTVWRSKQETDKNRFSQIEMNLLHVAGWAISKDLLEK